MYHGVWSKFCSRLHQRVPVADICFYQADIAIRQLAYAGERDGRTVRKIVEDADFMTYNSIGKIVESTAWLSLRFSRR
jgi:hypothetical protein